MDKKLNDFCRHGNPALDCETCIRAAETGGQITEKQEDEYLAKKYPVKIKKDVSKKRKLCRECNGFDLITETYALECFGCSIYHPNLFERRNKKCLKN